MQPTRLEPRPNCARVPGWVLVIRRSAEVQASRINWNCSGMVNHAISLFILNPDSKTQFSPLSQFPPASKPSVSLCFSLSREKGWEPSDVLSIQRRHELKRQIHRGWPACRDKGRPRRNGCECYKRWICREKARENEKTEIWLKEKPGRVKVQAKLRYPSKVQWSSATSDALIIFPCRLPCVLQFHKLHVEESVLSVNHSVQSINY